MMIPIPGWVKSRTLGLAFMVALLGLLVELEVALKAVEGVPGWAVTVIGVLIAAFRVITTRPLSEK
jgi:hypothetical protein